MNYVTTNIRILEEDYLRLKSEAAKSRKSLSAVIRQKLDTKKQGNSKAAIARLMAETRKIAEENARFTKSFNSVEALREIRYQK